MDSGDIGGGDMSDGGAMREPGGGDMGMDKPGAGAVDNDMGKGLGLGMSKDMGESGVGGIGCGDMGMDKPGAGAIKEPGGPGRGGISFTGEAQEPPKIALASGKPLGPMEKPIADKQPVIEAIKLVFDPDVNIDVYNLGLIYAIDIAKNGDAKIKMTLTSPTCPIAEQMVRQVADAAASVPGIGLAEVELVWEPPWSFAMLSQEAKYQLELGDLEF
jgi:metal-sulfur cluster biosynthetic enzyme